MTPEQIFNMKREVEKQTVLAIKKRLACIDISDDRYEYLIRLGQHLMGAIKEFEG